MDGWNTMGSFWGPAYFQGRLLFVLGSLHTFLIFFVLADGLKTTNIGLVVFSMLVLWLMEKIHKLGMPQTIFIVGPDQHLGHPKWCRFFSINSMLSCVKTILGASV